MNIHSLGNLVTGTGAALLSYSVISTLSYNIINSSVDFCQNQEAAQVINNHFKLAVSGLSLSYTGRLMGSWANRNNTNLTWHDVKRSIIALSIIGLAVYGAASSSEFTSALCGESFLKMYFFGFFTFLAVNALWYSNPVNEYLFTNPTT